jgi:hypothetical protein
MMRAMVADGQADGDIDSLNSLGKAMVPLPEMIIFPDKL